MRKGFDHAGEQLEVKIVNGALQITIGIGILCHAVQAGESTGWPDDWHIEDIPTFASEIVRELRHEEEDGTTPVHRMLDAAANSALEDGAGGIDEGDVEIGIALAKDFIDVRAGK